MLIDLSALSPNQVYATITQTLIPRPIAWVLSLNEAGTFNLAPFSYFNAVSSAPPLLMLSLGKKPDGSDKDTHANIRDRNHFVVHLAHRAQLTALNESAATLPAGDSELTRLGLATTPVEGFPLPRLSDCRVAFCCERYEIHQIGEGAQTLILGLIRAVYVDDAATGRDPKGRLTVDAQRVDPLARLGAAAYATFGEVVELKRPT